MSWKTCMQLEKKKKKEVRSVGAVLKGGWGHRPWRPVAFLPSRFSLSSPVLDIFFFFFASLLVLLACRRDDPHSRATAHHPTLDADGTRLPDIRVEDKRGCGGRPRASLSTATVLTCLFLTTLSSSPGTFYTIYFQPVLPMSRAVRFGTGIVRCGNLVGRSIVRATSRTA